MPQKSSKTLASGIIHLIPLIVISALIVGGASFYSLRTEKNQKDAVGRVLSSSSGDDSSGGSSGSGKSGSDSDEEKESQSTSGSSSSGSGSSGSIEIESRTGQTRTKIKTGQEKTKIEVRNEKGRFETKIEEGKEETKIRSGGLRIEIKKVGDQVITRIKNEDDEDVELDEDEQEDLFDQLEDELEEDDIEIATGSAVPGFIQKGHKVRTNFPLSVNPETGELFISTPAGERMVAILPDVAIQNMIRAGIMTRIVEEPPADASPTPPTGTDSATVVTPPATVEGAGIELTQEGDEVVYLISGVNSQNFLGLVPVDIKVKAKVSASDGQLVDIEQGLIARILDLFSF